MKRLIESLHRRFQSRREEAQGAEAQVAAHADFLPALQAIEQTPPHPLPRLMIGTIAALAGIGIVWSIVGQIDIVASAEGKLVPMSYVKIVQPAEQGVVKEILIREGQSVRAGQVLVRMDALAADADRQSLSADAAARALALRRIQAELAGGVLTQQAADPPALFAKVKAQFDSNRRSLEAVLAQEQAALQKARSDRAAAVEVKKKLADALPFYRQQDESYQKLAKDGFAGQILAQDKRREYLEKQQDLATQEFAITSAEATISQSEKKIAQISADYRRNLQAELTNETTLEEKARQELAKMEHRGRQLELKAPQDGVVKDLATHTPGTVVSPGTILMTLVPQGERLRAEVYVTNQDIGFVRSGQHTRVKLAAYPFQKYGLLEGQVLQVSADARESEAPASPGGSAFSGAEKPVAAQRAQSLTYKTVVELPAQTLVAQGRGQAPLDLRPGMAVTAEIKLGTRSVMEYLLSPVQGAFQEAGRER